MMTIVIIFIYLFIIDFQSCGCFMLAGKFFNASMLGHESWDMINHYMHVGCETFFLASLTLPSKGVE